MNVDNLEEIEGTHTIYDHVDTVKQLNELSELKRNVIFQYIVEGMPLIARKNEIAQWCHVQHALEAHKVIPKTCNVYALYILEKCHDNEVEDTFFASINKLLIDMN
jgi:hypothetical protein